MKAVGMLTEINNVKCAQDSAINQTVAFWNLGDWTSIVAESEHWNTEQKNKLALYQLVALLQCGELEQAKSLFATLPLSKAEQALLVRLLVSGVFNTLGKANACNFEHEKAHLLFKQSLDFGADFTVSDSMYEARTSTQIAQLGLPRIQPTAVACDFTPDLAYLLQSAKPFFTQEPVLDLALADYYQREQSFDLAIVHWQQVSAILDKDTPQAYYDRLKDAYKQGKGFPLATVQQEALKGDIDKHKLLSAIHNKLNPEFYFEIGVQTGKSLALAKCEAVGVDPMPLLNVALGSNAKVITASSDAFFELKSDVLLTKAMDFAFIDGMHLFEYALRDFINAERHARPYSLIVIDDIYPGHADQAKRDRCTRAWTGDVWKVKAVLEQYRPDLVMLAVDAYPTGLLLITGLDAENTVLQDHYDAILQQYIHVESVPEEIMQRSDALSGNNEYIYQLIELLKDGKKQKLDAKTIKDKWSELFIHNVS